MGREDHLRSELGLLTDEYKALKAEIVSNLNSARQILGLAFVAIGVLIGGGRFLIESGKVDLFLVAPVFFYALAWAQLRYVFLVLDMGAHLRCVVAPHVRQVLADLAEGGEHNFDHILSWENHGKSPVRRLGHDHSLGHSNLQESQLAKVDSDAKEGAGRNDDQGRRLPNRLCKLLFIPIAGANFGIPLLASVSSVIAFFVFRNSDVGVSNGEFVLLAMNLLALVYSAAWGAVAEQAR